MIINLHFIGDLFEAGSGCAEPAFGDQIKN